MIGPADLQDVLGAWWFNYDEGNFDALRGLLTSDVEFSVRTDTDRVAWAEFARGHAQGRDQVMEWQIQHRRDSPYPLRHHGTNVHIVDRTNGDVAFASYIHVTHIVEEMPAGIPGGIVTGAVREEDGRVRIAALHVVLDTETSKTFSAVK